MKSGWYKYRGNAGRKLHYFPNPPSDPLCGNHRGRTQDPKEIHWRTYREAPEHRTCKNCLKKFHLFDTPKN